MFKVNLVKGLSVVRYPKNLDDEKQADGKLHFQISFQWHNEN